MRSPVNPQRSSTLLNSYQLLQLRHNITAQFSGWLEEMLLYFSLMYVYVYVSICKTSNSAVLQTELTSCCIDEQAGLCRVSVSKSVLSTKPRITTLWTLRLPTFWGNRFWHMPEHFPLSESSFQFYFVSITLHLHFFFFFFASLLSGVLSDFPVILSVPQLPRESDQGKHVFWSCSGWCLVLYIKPTLATTSPHRTKTTFSAPKHAHMAHLRGFFYYCHHCHFLYTQGQTMAYISITDTMQAITSYHLTLMGCLWLDNAPHITEKWDDY